MNTYYKNKKTPSGNPYKTPASVMQGREDAILNEQRRRERAKIADYKRMHPTESYGPLLKTIKQLILEYKELQNQLWAYEAFMLDLADKMGYNLERARIMIEKKSELPNSLKSWAKKNELSQEDTLRLLKENEFNFIKYFIIKRGFVTNDETLRINIAKVKKDLEIEKTNGTGSSNVER